MKLQVLVSAMHIDNMEQFIKQMNLQTEAIIINQCDKNDFQEKSYKGKKIKMYSFNERGVGLSRNNALMRANSDIVLIADEDMRYVDGYEEKILNEFSKNPKADMIVFNAKSDNEDRKISNVDKVKKLNKYNCGRYGAIRFAIKLDAIREKNIYFSLLFGGGAKYQCGEDSVFIKECIDKGFKVYTNPTLIGFAKQEGSTWFKGYDEKYFFDKGKLFKTMFNRLAKIYALQYLVRHRDVTEKLGFKKAYIMIKEGINSKKK